MAVEDIVRFIQLDDRIGLAGQPTAEQFEDVKDAGYEVVISLVPEEQDNALKGEGALVERLGMAFHYIPVPWTAPEEGHVAAFQAAMAEVEGRKTLIHCAANMRVTAFYAIHAMRELGWSAVEADVLIERMWTIQGESRLDGPWLKLVEDAKAAASA